MWQFHAIRARELMTDRRDAAQEYRRAAHRGPESRSTAQVKVGGRRSRIFHQFHVD